MLDFYSDSTKDDFGDMLGSILVAILIVIGMLSLGYLISRILV